MIKKGMRLENESSGGVILRIEDNIVEKNIKKNYSKLYKAEKKVADYILENRDQILYMSISDLAKASDTSDATIIRMCKHIGYSGFYKLKIALASTKNLSAKVKKIDEPDNIIEFFESVSTQLQNVVKNINADVFKKCLDLISSADMVFTGAWGNTNEIAADLAHRLTRKGIKSFNSDIPEYFMRSLGLGKQGDVLVMISHSGESIHCIDALKLAKDMDVKTILITNSQKSTAADISDYVLCTGAKETLFADLGGESHFLELIIVDSLLYFLQDIENRAELSDKAEYVLSKYKN